nr:inosine/xanthosine triphosphatase [Marinomonas algarum]
MPTKPRDQIHIQVGSTNPIKVAAAKEAFTLMFPDIIIDCHGINAPSNVSDQPMTESETRQGAQNRARYCASHDIKKQMDYYVAMEGGVDQFEEGAATFAYVSILSADHNLLAGRSANLPLPAKIFQRLQHGEELGSIIDEVFQTDNVKQKGGAIGMLTNQLATRQSIYVQALLLAMAPVFHPKLYQDQATHDWEL